MTELDSVEQAAERYKRARPTFVDAAKAVAVEVEACAHRIGAYATVTARAKELDSFVKKALSKSGYAADAWVKTTDKAGVRAVLSDPTTLYPLVEELEAQWHDRLVGPRDDKRLKVELDQFTYSGVHLQIVVPDFDTDGERVECEVQIRSAAQDAWASIEHQYVYKGLVELPDQTRRAMFALVALTELFDEEVKRTVRTALDHPDYPQLKLEHDIERAFYKLTHWRFDRALTAQIVEPIMDALPVAQRAGYADHLAAFVAGREQDLMSRLYGRRDELGHVARYALITQPEALFLAERAENAEMLLAHAIHRAGPDLKRLVEPILALWGRPLPDPD